MLPEIKIKIASKRQANIFVTVQLFEKPMSESQGHGGLF
jgi:hypothetical protein